MAYGEPPICGNQQHVRSAFRTNNSV